MGFATGTQISFDTYQGLVTTLPVFSRGGARLISASFSLTVVPGAFAISCLCKAMWNEQITFSVWQPNEETILKYIKGHP